MHLQNTNHPSSACAVSLLLPGQGDLRGGLVVRVPPPEWEVVGLIPGCDRPKSFKLVVVAFPLGAQDYGNSTTTLARQYQDNGLVENSQGNMDL